MSGATGSALDRKLSSGERVTSVELLPPRGGDPSAMLERARRVKGAGVDAVNVTDGPRASARMGVLAACALIQREAGIETISHYTCRDRNLLGMISDLLGAHAWGLRNLLIITGDLPGEGPYPEATAVFDTDAVGLAELVRGLNEGRVPAGEPLESATDFCVGVGVNPLAGDLDREVGRLERKVEAGARFAITQPIFDPDAFEKFRERLDGLQISLIVGLWPLTSLRNAEFLNERVAGIRVPDPALERMREVDGDPAAARAEGVTIAREVANALGPGVAGFQLAAPGGNVDLALSVLRGLDL